MKKNKNKGCMAADMVSRLTAVAEYILTHTYENLVNEVDLLFTALFLDSPAETEAFLARNSDNLNARYTASEVLVYHKDPEVFARGVTNGFFNYEVGRLLKVAKQNRIAGARFIPIFITALLHACELGLSDEVKEALEQHIEYQKKLDGFVILNANDELAILADNELIPM